MSLSIPNQPMKINLTFLEVLLFGLCLSLTVLWLKYGKRLKRWWKEWRKKQVDTTGYACLHIWCKYFGNTDPAVHALVSDGYRGKNRDILYLRCQCCGKRKTSRAGTPMYRLKTPLHEVARVMTAPLDAA